MWAENLVLAMWVPFSLLKGAAQQSYFGVFLLGWMLRARGYVNFSEYPLNVWAICANCSPKREYKNINYLWGIKLHP